MKQSKKQGEDDGELNPKIMSTVDRGGTGAGGIIPAILTILVLAFVGGAIYLYISVGDTEEIKRVLTGFFTKEFANQLKESKSNKQRKKF